MKRLLTTTALGLALATGPAMAQTSDTTNSPAETQSPSVEQMKPETGETKPDMKLDNQPATQDSTTVRPPQESAERPTAKNNETVAANFDGYRASELIGATVENARGENVGEINDIVLGEDGSANAALIGVGGFLGLGQKDVAIDFNELNVQKTDGSFKVTIAMSAESLQAMPAYKADADASGDSDRPATGMTPQNDAPAGQTNPAQRPN